MVTGCVAQSVARLTQEPEDHVRYPVRTHTFVSPFAESRRAVVSYWRKYVHEVLVNCLEGLSLPRKSVVRLTDRPEMTIDVYRGRKTTTQQQQLSRIAHQQCQRCSSNIILILENSRLLALIHSQTLRAK